MADAAFLSIRGLGVRFGGVLALDDVSVDVAAHEIVGIIGPNGAGKTTLFNVLSRLVRPERGTVRAGASDLLRLRPDEVIRAGIARTFQNVEIFPRMTVLEHVLMGQHRSVRGGIWSCGLRLDGFRRAERAARERALSTLEFLGLADDAHQLARDLPYGRLKLLELARAVVADPRLILLDEPMAGLSRQEKEKVLGALRTLYEKVGVGLVLVEHDMRVVMETAQRVVVLDYGQKIAEGAPAEVQRNERVLEAYLGKAQANAARA